MSDGSRSGFLALERLMLDQLRTGVLRFCDQMRKVLSGSRSEPGITVCLELAAQKADQVVVRALPELLQRRFNPLPLVSFRIH